MEKSKSKFIRVLYLVTASVTLAVALVFALHGVWGKALQGLLGLVCLGVPYLVERMFDVRLTAVTEGAAVLFLFACLVLGEVWHFYEKIPLWDDWLHLISGFLFCAFGFALVAGAERRWRGWLALCFALSLGCLWEFLEFFSDRAFMTDMQKDVFLPNLVSSALGEGRTVLRNVGQMMVDGTPVGQAGYLDIGLTDTMRDLMVGGFGAFLFLVLTRMGKRIGGSVRCAFVPRRNRKGA